jgi:hypothetical protein
MEYQFVGALWNVGDQRLAPSVARKILMQPQPELPHMDANRAVLDRTVVLRLAKDSSSDALFREFSGIPMNGAFGQIAQ